MCLVCVIFVFHRGGLKWQTAGHSLAGHEDDSREWNAALVSEALPHALYHAVKYAISNGLDFDDVMKLFPDKSRVDDNWQPTLKPFYRLIENEEIFYSEDGKKWVPSTNACIIPSSCAQKDVIRKVLLKSKQTSNLVTPPTHLLREDIPQPREVGILFTTQAYMYMIVYWSVVKHYNIYSSSSFHFSL